jgi:hypothetical protein
MNLKNFGFWDVSLTKLSVLFATLFVVSIWPQFADWVATTHWAWFLIPALIFAIKPLASVFKKSQ